MACGTGGLVRATRVWFENMEVVFVLAKNGQQFSFLLGCVGAVKEISTQPGNKHFAAVGLDRFSNHRSSPVRHQQLSTYRFLRVWEHGRGGKLAKHKIYLKSRLNCVLLTRYRSFS